MIRRKISFLTILLILILVATSTNVYAKDITPPENDGRQVESNGGNQQSSGITQASTTSSILLGKPGLSFSYAQTIGETGVAYPDNTSYLNTPSGLFTKDGFLYVAEEYGGRILKIDLSDGSVPLTIGRAGNNYLDESRPAILNFPKDVTVDSNGNIWTTDYQRIVEFSSTGQFIRSFPDWNHNPWETGDGADRFNDPRGLAFGSDGKLYVADRSNNRVQVFTIDADGAPVYDQTITGISGDSFNNPFMVAFDSSNRLYVVEFYDHQVDRCTFNGSTWDCSLFFGVSGQPGNDLTHLDSPDGLTIDGSDNIFISDGNNQRVLKCDTSAVCSVFAGNGASGGGNQSLLFASQVTTDTSGNVYVSDWSNSCIKKFDKDGNLLDVYGTPGIPYATDSTSLNRPHGVTIAADGSIFVTEESGYRLVKYAADGTREWTFGQAGSYGWDDSHLGSFWIGLMGGPAIDGNGKIYLPDPGNHRIVILNANGTYSDSFGSYGTAPGQFDAPTAIAINPINGDIYVAEMYNQRVQIFNRQLQFKTVIGGNAGQSGNDNTHFSDPHGIAISSTGVVYIADYYNYRVQKCNVAANYSWACTTFAGETGNNYYDHGYLSAPSAVTVDEQGRVYVADEWNNRVEVYDANGGYLTTIGGTWGSDTTGQMMSPNGVAVDPSGNVYVADRDNMRVEKFTNGYPDWEQINLNGFGTIDNYSTWALGSFKGVLYAGTDNNSGNGAQIWKRDSTSITGWQETMADGFGNSDNEAIDHLLEYDGKLYASTMNSVDGGQLWRSTDGTNWEPITQNGFGDTGYGEIFQLAILNNQLCASTWSYADGQGAQIWCSSTGNADSWTKWADNGFGDSNNFGFPSMLNYQNSIFVNTYNYSGTQLWRKTGTSAWSQVDLSDFADPVMQYISSMEVFNHQLYVVGGNSNYGTKIYRCTVCSGSDWQEVEPVSFSDTNRRGMTALIEADGKLFVVLPNRSVEGGLEVWQTGDGQTWIPIATGGFGNVNSRSPYWGNSVLSFNHTLYIGVSNYAVGGQIWQHSLVKYIYLPLVIR